MASPYQIALCATLVAQAFNIFAKGVEKAVGRWGLTMSQYLTLFALFLRPSGLTPTEIARLLPIQTQSVSPLLDRLQERKLVVRRRSAHDRRSVRVTLTEKGEELIREMDSAVPDIINYVFGSLSNEELEIFEPLMRKIRDAAARWVGARPEHLDVTIERLVPRV